MRVSPNDQFGRTRQKNLNKGDIMKKNILSAIVLAGLAFAPVSGFAKSDVIGGLIGGFIGSQIGKGDGKTAATIIGAIIGSRIGGDFDYGRDFGNGDLWSYNNALNAAMENNNDGQSSSWNNYRTGNFGTITPLNEYQTSNYEYCRDYSSILYVNGGRRRITANGTACASSPNQWHIVNESKYDRWGNNWNHRRDNGWRGHDGWRGRDRWGRHDGGRRNDGPGRGGNDHGRGPGHGGDRGDGNRRH